MVNKLLISPYFCVGYVRGGRLTSHEFIQKKRVTPWFSGDWILFCTPNVLDSRWGYVIFTYSTMCLIGTDHGTLPETNISPENWAVQKGNVIFQPSIFRVYVGFREVTHNPSTWCLGISLKFLNHEANRGFKGGGFNLIHSNRSQKWYSSFKTGMKTQQMIEMWNHLLSPSKKKIYIFT